MDTEDIRFSSVDDCLNIVEDLNKKNVSVYFFTYDENIKEEKVNNIQSFLNGLIKVGLSRVLYIDLKAI